MADVFGVKASIPRNKEYMAAALADQVKAFVESDTEDVKSVVPEAYEKAQIGQETIGYSFTSTKYTGDQLWVEKKDLSHTVACYSTFQHCWVIHNTGSCDWIGRKLMLINKTDIPASFSTNVVDVPYTERNHIARVVVDVDVHQLEDEYIAYWIMIDEDGADCFPGPMNKSIFAVKFNVTFDPNSN